MSFRDKQTVMVTRLKLDPAAISAAMCVSVGAVHKLMQDNGRAVSFWAKYWASDAYDVLIDEANHERETTALSGEFGTIGKVRAAIRTLGNGSIRFQRNTRIGARRSCTQQELIEDLHKFDVQIVISISKFPEIYLYPLSAKILLAEAMAGQLTPNGITARNFVGWVAQRYHIEYRDYVV